MCNYGLEIEDIWILIGLQNIEIVILTISDTLIYIRTFLTVLFLGTEFFKFQLYFSNFKSLDYLEGMITWRVNAAKAYIKYTYWLWRYWWQKLFVWRIWSLIVSRRQQILDLKSRNINMLESIFKIYVN